MAACSNYVSRFKKALKFRRLKFPQDIIDLMGKRSKTDRSLDRILFSVINIIEPSSCTKSHCPHHTTFSFCNCSLDLVPAKCELHRAYRKRVKEREEKQFQDRLSKVPEKYLPLSDENTKRVREMDKYTWAKFIHKNKKLEK